MFDITLVPGDFLTKEATFSQMFCAKHHLLFQVYKISEDTIWVEPIVSEITRYQETYGKRNKQGFAYYFYWS